MGRRFDGTRTGGQGYATELLTNQVQRDSDLLLALGFDSDEARNLSNYTPP